MDLTGEIEFFQYNGKNIFNAMNKRRVGEIKQKPKDMLPVF
ncbi:hypothetical protein NNO_0469 [Hydrogenimonas sp.]|nr:hypothetical protein NNO_0469 [Hydrogenimonas sp.]